MRLVRFEKNGSVCLGVELQEGGNVVDLTAFDSSFSSSMKDFIAGGATNILKAKRAVESGQNIVSRHQTIPLAPIIDPDKLICIGMNYKDHCQEFNIPIPKEPLVFSKFNSCIVGPSHHVPYPSVTKELDWEVELAIVIGKGGKDIDPQDAVDHVFGYTVALDLSARDWQTRNGGQVLLAKSMDGFCPLGPAVITKEDVADVHNLHLWTKVNGVTKQDSSTKELIFKTQHLISHLSKFFTLQPGDTILTGTPPGVGAFRKPPEFLKVGDEVEVGIESIGNLSIKIV